MRVPDGSPIIRPDTRLRYAVPPHLRFPKSAASLLESLISMVPGCGMKPFPFTASPHCSSATRTGRKLLVVPAVLRDGASASGTPGWHSRRAVGPLSIPTLPGTSVSSTIARRSAFVRHRCFLPGSPAWCECVSVSTIPLRGHKHQVHIPIILIHMVGVHTVGIGRLHTFMTLV
jgi:hypothetical protein